MTKRLVCSFIILYPLFIKQMHSHSVMLNKVIAQSVLNFYETGKTDDKYQREARFKK